MLSFWEKQSLLNYDTIIVGAGIVGLSTALSIREQDAAKRILVLERAILPTGASTKNAGFACIGSLTEILDDLTRMPEEEVKALVELRLEGLRKLRARLGDDKIGYAEHGSYELIAHDNDDCTQQIERINDLLRPILNADAYKIDDAKLDTFGFSKTHIKHVVSNNCEGELNSGMMMRALIDLCMSKGIEIKTGCDVSRVEEGGNTAHVILKHSYLNQEIAFSASQVAICTNAFTKHLYPATELHPGRGQVLITKPIDGLKFKGVFHFDEGYYYFRRLGDRVLFGGGRNQDFEGERSSEFAYNPKVQGDLLDKLKTVILPDTGFEVEDWWTGIMAFGDTKFPIVKQHSPHIYIGVRMGGMGVAIGSRIGEELAEMMNQ